MNSRLAKMEENFKRYQALIKENDAHKEQSNRDYAIEKRTAIIEQVFREVPLRFRDKSFSDYVIENPLQARVIKIAMRYVEEFKSKLSMGSSLILKGTKGTGKTFVSLIMAQALAKQGFHVRYESSLEFVRTMIDVKFKSQAAYLGLLQVFSQIDFLIIDEVTESISKDGMPTELEKQVLFQIINQRYEKKLCTAVITNRDHHELVARLSEQMIDRLSEKGLTLAFNWPSYRQR